MADDGLSAVGDDDGPPVEDAVEVLVGAPVVVALAVDDGDAEPGPGEAGRAPGLGERLLRGALADTVAPRREVVRVARHRQHRPDVVDLARRAGAALAHRVHLPGADEDVVPGAPVSA